MVGWWGSGDDCAHTVGLADVPDVGDNGVHASASPFEALAERSNWLSGDVATDPFGKLLRGLGVKAATISAWCLDPQVNIAEGKEGTEMGSLFDAVEDLDTRDCLEKLFLLDDDNEMAADYIDPEVLDKLVALNEGSAAMTAADFAEAEDLSAAVADLAGDGGKTAIRFSELFTDAPLIRVRWRLYSSHMGCRVAKPSCLYSNPILGYRP
jgi:hypothetical protein